MNDRRGRRDQKPTEESPLFSYKSERIVVGMALQDSAFFNAAHGKIQAQDFSIPRVARVWEAMVKSVEKGRPPTKTWVPLNIQGDREDSQHEPLLFFLNLLINDALEEGASSAEIHVETVLHLSRKRALLDALDAAKRDILHAEFGMAPEKLQDIALTKVHRSFQTDVDGHIQTYGDWANKVVAEVQVAKKQDESGGIGLTCGLGNVEKVIGRLLPGKAYYLAGMSGAGKSGLAAQILEAAMLDAAAKGLGWGYMASLEMTGQEYAARGLARSMGISSSDIEIGNVDWAQLDSMVNHAQGLKKYNIEIDSTPRMTMDVIKAHAIGTRNRRGKLAIAVVDHLVIVAGEKGESLFDKVSSASLKVKEMAKELGIPVLVLAQLDEKKILESKSKWPNASHLFGGQTITQNADVVAFIHRPEMVLAKTEPSMDDKSDHDKWVLRMDAARNKAVIFNDKRRGGKGRVMADLHFHGETITFSDV